MCVLINQYAGCCLLLSLYKHVYVDDHNNFDRELVTMHIQVSTWFANARRRMKKASTDDEETKSSSNCSSPESPGRSASPEEKSTVVVDSTFSSAITVGGDKDTRGE